MSAKPYNPKTTRLRSFHDQVPAFRDGTDTPRAYLERCLEEIDNREADVKAFVTLNVEGARAAADASTKRYTKGASLSEIDGQPMGVKDLFESEDMPTQCGSPIFAGNETGRDSALIAGLRQAGAVILGKTVTTEFAFYSPGPTRNPFDLTCTPGGSSSGSGAAVGAGFVPVAIGSQVVGSLIRPSSFNANYGFKPSFGAINREGAYFNLRQTALGTQAASLTDAWTTARVATRFAGGDPGHTAFTHTHEGKRFSTEVKVAANAFQQFAASRPGNAHDRPVIGYRCEKYLKFRPLGLQPAFHPGQYPGGATGGGMHQEMILGEPHGDAVIHDHTVFT